MSQESFPMNNSISQVQISDRISYTFDTNGNVVHVKKVNAEKLAPAKREREPNLNYKLPDINLKSLKAH